MKISSTVVVVMLSLFSNLVAANAIRDPAALDQSFRRSLGLSELSDVELDKRDCVYRREIQLERWRRDCPYNKRQDCPPPSCPPGCVPPC